MIFTLNFVAVNENMWSALENRRTSKVDWAAQNTKQKRPRATMGWGRRWYGDGEGARETTPLAAAATHLSSIKSATRGRTAVELLAIIFAIILSVITIASHPYPYPYRSEKGMGLVACARLRFECQLGTLCGFVSGARPASCLLRHSFYGQLMRLCCCDACRVRRATRVCLGYVSDVGISLVSSLVIAICGNGRNWFSFLRFTDFCIGHSAAVWKRKRRTMKKKLHGGGREKERGELRLDALAACCEMLARLKCHFAAYSEYVLGIT